MEALGATHRLVTQRTKRKTNRQTDKPTNRKTTKERRKPTMKEEMRKESGLHKMGQLKVDDGESLMLATDQNLYMTP